MKHTVLINEQGDYEILNGIVKPIGRYYQKCEAVDISDEDIATIQDIKEDVRLELNEILSNYLK